MTTKLLILTMLLYTVVTSVHGQEKGIEFQQGSLETVLKSGSNQNKLIFLDAYATWCRPCKELEKYVFPDATVADYFNKTFVNTRVDMEKGEGPGLAELFEVTAYPTLLFLDHNLQIVGRHEGALDAEQFVALGESVIEYNPLYKEQKEKYDKNVKEKSFLLEYVKTLEALGLDAETVANEYLQQCSETELLRPESAELILSYTSNIDAKEFKTFYSHRSRYEEILGLKSVHNKFMRVFFASLNAIIEKETFSELEYKTNQSKINSLGTAEGSLAILYYDVYRFKKVGDFDNLAQATLKLAGIDICPDDLLNSMAWYLSENCNDQNILRKGLEISKLSLQGTENAAYYDTYAALLLKLNDVKKAITFQEMAIRYAEYDGEDTKSYIETLNKMKVKAGH